MSAKRGHPSAEAGQFPGRRARAGRNSQQSSAVFQDGGNLSACLLPSLPVPAVSSCSFQASDQPAKPFATAHEYVYVLFSGHFSPCQVDDQVHCPYLYSLEGFPLTCPPGPPGAEPQCRPGPPVTRAQVQSCLSCEQSLGTFLLSPGYNKPSIWQ